MLLLAFDHSTKCDLACKTHAILRTSFFFFFASKRNLQCNKDYDFPSKPPFKAFACMVVLSTLLKPAANTAQKLSVSYLLIATVSLVMEQHQYSLHGTLVLPPRHTQMRRPKDVDPDSTRRFCPSIFPTCPSEMIPPQLLPTFLLLLFFPTALQLGLSYCKHIAS